MYEEISKEHCRYFTQKRNGGCQLRRIEVRRSGWGVRVDKKNWGEGGSGGCVRRIEVIVKMQKKSRGEEEGGGGRGGGGGRLGGCDYVYEELKLL